MDRKVNISRDLSSINQGARLGADVPVSQVCKVSWFLLRFRSTSKSS